MRMNKLKTDKDKNKKSIKKKTILLIMYSQLFKQRKREICVEYDFFSLAVQIRKPKKNLVRYIFFSERCPTFMILGLLWHFFLKYR